MSKIHYLIYRYIYARENGESAEYWRRRLKRKGVYDICIPDKEYKPYKSGNTIMYFKSWMP